MMVAEQDLLLVERAREILKKRFAENRHTIAAALRTCSGKVYASVHHEANIGRIAVCAEAIALGMAAADGDPTIDTIVAVNRHGRIVPPCGMCREMISDYSPEAFVLLEQDHGLIRVPVLELLPFKYKR